MPKLVPLVLALATTPPVNETYDPATNNGVETELVDNSPSMVYDARFLRVKVRPAGAGNTGRSTDHLGVRPIPLASGEGCCVDVTKPEGNTFRITTMLRKSSSKAQGLELVEMIKAYVATTEFRELVTSSSYYA